MIFDYLCVNLVFEKQELIFKQTIMNKIKLLAIAFAFSAIPSLVMAQNDRNDLYNVANIKRYAEVNKQLPAKQKNEKRVVFIGNSITCGYGIESTDPKEGFSDETENHYYSYAAITARNLQAQHLVVARSGIGIYRNYGAPKTGSKDNMPSMYEQTLFGVPSEKWNFAKYTPDVVCVNLGTNDTSLNNYDRDFLVNGYRNFLITLRKHYPNAKIVFLTGSMLLGQALEHVKYAMDDVVREARIAGDKQVYRFDMSWQTGDLGYGADYHPSKWQHEKMAGELTAYLRGLMNWF